MYRITNGSYSSIASQPVGQTGAKWMDSIVANRWQKETQCSATVKLNVSFVVGAFRCPLFDRLLRLMGFNQVYCLACGHAGSQKDVDTTFARCASYGCEGIAPIYKSRFARAMCCQIARATPFRMTVQSEIMYAFRRVWTYWLVPISTWVLMKRYHVCTCCRTLIGHNSTSWLIGLARVFTPRYTRHRVGRQIYQLIARVNRL